MASVLLVEDEVLIRIMIAAMVEELGHVVAAEAGNIEAGCDLAENADFDLALLDVNVGGAMITPVAEVIERRGLPFLFATGYATTGLPKAFQGKPVLRKPFPIEQLRDALDAIIGA
jgi:CheY-like chemotaxis protein